MLLETLPQNREVQDLGYSVFFGEVFSEMKKVTWPSREETTRLTMLVLAVSIAIGAMLGVLDFFFTTISDQVLF